MDESILCIPAPVVKEWLGNLQGFRSVRRDDFCKLLGYWRYVPRAQAEQDPTYKQIIPYVIVPKSDDCRDVLLTYERGKAGAESRLHGKTAIGLGGHIEAGESVTEAASREIGEEVKGMGAYSLTFVGLVNEDESEVGKVHLGAVYRVDRYEPLREIKSKEDALRNLTWADRTALNAWAAEGLLERWAAHCVANLDSILSIPTFA